VNLDDERAATLRMQLAAVKKPCEYPGCDDQATGARKISKVVMYLCDPHLVEDNAGLAVVEQTVIDAEHRGRYPNGLTHREWYSQRGQ
jgi:hypothetical protein